MIKSFISSLFSKKQIKEDIKKEMPNIQTPIKGNRILIISDIHFPFSDKEIEKLQEIYDICLVLGDVDKQNLLLINQLLPCNIYAVFGNHDVEYTLDDTRIEHLHGVQIIENDLSITGISGSSKYKEKSPYFMLTQEESSSVAKGLKSSKVLISHDSPYQFHSTENNKEGLIGITEYIKEKHPKLHLYGHHHMFKSYTLNDTLCICNYRFGIIERDGKYYPFAE